VTLIAHLDVDFDCAFKNKRQFFQRYIFINTHSTSLQNVQINIYLYGDSS
jgi:hypothetical protein